MGAHASALEGARSRTRGRACGVRAWARARIMHV